MMPAMTPATPGPFAPPLPAVSALAEGASDGSAVGWLAALAIAVAWLATSAVRRRSARRLERRLADPAAGPADGAYPLLDRTASAALRRMRDDRARQERLSDRLAETERVLRATPIAVIALDHMQRVVSANPAAERLLGIDERAARGRLLQDSVRLPPLNRLVASALSDDGRASTELRLDLDPPLEVQASCEPLHADDRPPGLVLSLVDVTRMRRLESMRSEFAANVSHELRTPITNIKGYVETLLQVGVEDPARLQRFLEIVHRNTVRLSGIVEDILTLAFLEEPEARRSIARAPCPADEIVAQVVEDLGTAAAVRSVALEVRGLRGAWVLANRSLAEQALANLVSNAIKYTKDGTSVAIDLSTDAGFVRMAVVDRGPGIAPRHLPRLFERFYRIDAARDRAKGGTGLGLSIVKHIAAIHGGRVEVASTISEGCSFSLLLPEVAVGAATSDAPEALPGE